LENIKKNDIVNIIIDGMNHEGQGVGRVNGLTVFVEGAMLHEKVEAKVVKLAKSYAVGKLLNIIEPSEGRVEPLCPSSKRCGGCSLQHMDYTHQLKFKTNLVRDSIKRIGKLENIMVYETIGMVLPSQYRNKAQYPVGCNTEDTPILGFYAKRTHEIIDTPNCMIQDKRSDRVRECIRDFIHTYKVSTYDEETGLDTTCYIPRWV
jgi:23S rRNA (uracil1939-C5)-methyltransferase